MTSTFDSFSRRPLVRRAGVAMLGLLSLTLVVACSNYGTTGSGGTTGAGGAGTGVGAGGPIATPSGGNNVGASSGSTGSQESRTGGPVPSGTQIVPTSGTSMGAGVGAESTGTPRSAGTGAVAATRDAVTSGPDSNTVVRTPAASPSPTGTMAPR